jgi:hypothetical protein
MKKFVIFGWVMSVLILAVGDPSALASTKNANNNKPSESPTQKALDSTKPEPTSVEERGEPARMPASRWWTVGPFDRADR